MVAATPKNISFISYDKKVDVCKMSTQAYSKQYCMEYKDYPLADFASRMLGLQRLGVTVTHRAKAHLNNLLTGAPVAKTSAPIDPTTRVKAVSDAVLAAPPKEPKAPKAPKEPKDPSATKEPRGRRDKLASDAKIKKLADNPAREGTIRHAIVETIFQSKTVAMACDSTVERKDGTEYKIGIPDIYFCVDNGLIELA
jgi:hypothetical protein